uniref:hypothetical protein n=1 Tax=Alistipes sp. TaxID=1872444 RepID=UPI0040560668
MHTDTSIDKEHKLAAVVQSVQNKKMEEAGVKDLKLAEQPAPKPSNSNVGELIGKILLTILLFGAMFALTSTIVGAPVVVYSANPLFLKIWE